VVAGWDYNRFTMRLFAGLLILLAAGAAFPQTAPKLDVLHGREGVKEFEVRPDVKVSVRYGPDGMACHMEIKPTGQAIPIETMTGILDEIVPPKIRGQRVSGPQSFQSSCGFSSLTRYENLGMSYGGSLCTANHVTVQGAWVDFTRTVCHNDPKQSGLPAGTFVNP